MIRLDIVRDGPVREDNIGHYDCYLYLPPAGPFLSTSDWQEYHVRVENFNRNDGWAVLVARAVQALEKVVP